jgi:peptide/nickel transport system permease protein
MRHFIRALSASKSGMFGALVVTFFILVAILAPVLAPTNPDKMDLRGRFAPPTLTLSDVGKHPLGADQIGRDILSRVIVGSRITFTVAGTAVLIGAIVGVWLGLLAGYFGGWTERIIMRLADMQLSIPLMLFALIIIAALGPSLVNLIVVLALTGWTRFARITRGEVLSLREREFVHAARATGGRPLRILAQHVVPNAVGPIIVYATLTVPAVMLEEAFLSFLGLGVQPPMASWGSLASEGAANLDVRPWLILFPGLALTVTLFSLNFLGDGLRDALDPQVSR